LGVVAVCFYSSSLVGGVSGMSDRDLRLQRRLKAKKARAFRRRVAALAIVVLLVVVLVAAYSFWGGGGPASSSSRVLLVTSKGDITIELYNDMPVTAGNFRNLVNSGIYDGTIFHRVVANFVIQGGDRTGTGQGDPGIPTIPDELPNKHSNVRGAVAKTDQPNSATSQFFINLKDNSANLDSNYSVFGHVVEGMNVVDAIGSVAVENERPVQNVTLVRAQLIG
jgi:peptidylprolyl isomerase